MPTMNRSRATSAAASPAARAWLLIRLLVPLVGCSPGSVARPPGGTRCYDTGHGIVCVDDGKEPDEDFADPPPDDVDADGDGTPDTPVCEDGDSEPSESSGEELTADDPCAAESDVSDA